MIDHKKLNALELAVAIVLEDSTIYSPDDRAEKALKIAGSFSDYITSKDRGEEIQDKFPDFNPETDAYLTEEEANNLINSMKTVPRKSATVDEEEQFFEAFNTGIEKLNKDLRNRFPGVEIEWRQT